MVIKGRFLPPRREQKFPIGIAEHSMVKWMEGKHWIDCIRKLLKQPVESLFKAGGILSY